MTVTKDELLLDAAQGIERILQQQKRRALLDELELLLDELTGPFARLNNVIRQLVGPVE
jgi:hypothetical protein